MPNVHIWFPLGGSCNGREEVKGIISPLHDATEASRLVMIALLSAEGDTMLCVRRARVVVKKDLGFMPGDGVEIDVAGAAIYKVVEGLILEEVTEEDGMKVLQQLGVSKV